MVLDKNRFPILFTLDGSGYVTSTAGTGPHGDHAHTMRNDDAYLIQYTIYSGYKHIHKLAVLPLMTSGGLILYMVLAIWDRVVLRWCWWVVKIHFLRRCRWGTFLVVQYMLCMLLGYFRTVDVFVVPIEGILWTLSFTIRTFKIMVWMRYITIKCIISVIL